MSSQHLPPELEAQFAGRFRLIQEFAGGEGWTARVLEEATGKETERVLKVLDEAGDLQEASLLASLRHHRIPSVLEAGRLEDGRAYLLREYARGHSLSELRPMAAADLQELALQVLEILAYVHLRGILHLDIKPANLLCDQENGRTVYRLLDFGLGGRSSDGSRGGSLFFASPEQLLGVQPDARADLFSVGALLYSMLQDSNPDIRRFIARFPREDFFAACDSHPDDLPHPFNRLIPRLVARQPRNRYLDAQEALEALAPGSGRPSFSALIPDPVASYGSLVEESISQLGPEEGLEIRGGSAEDRRAMALHGACLLEDLQRVETKPDVCSILRHSQREKTICSLPQLDRQAITAHMQDSLSLDSEGAKAAAELAIREGATSPASLRVFLEGLVKSADIIPDGTGWHWPAAFAGRLEMDQGVEGISTDPEGIRGAAALGRVEQAVASYQHAAGKDSADEAVLRKALVQGLLRAGEPRRALPLAHDLPGLRARALLDLGDLQSAESQLANIAEQTAPLDPEQLRMQAWIDFLKGNYEQAAEQVVQLRAEQDLPEDRIVEGYLLAARDESEAARSTLREALNSLVEEEQPFLYAAGLTNLGELERQAGELEEALRHHTRARQIYRSLGNIRHTATASSNLGVVNKDLGEYDRAFVHLRQAKSLFERVEDREGAILAEANLGIVSLEMGDWAMASRRLSTAIKKLEALGSRHALPMLNVLLARALAEEGQAAKARSILGSIDLEASIRLRRHANCVEETLAKLEGQTTSQAHMPTKEDERSGISKSIFRTIVAINRKLAACSDARQALKHVLESAVTLAGAREGYVLLGGQNGVQFELSTKESLANSAFSRSLANKAISQQRSLSAEDALADQDLMDMPSVRDLQVKSVLCVPFSSSRGMSGALYVEHAGRGRAFSEVDLETLEVLADQAAIAIDRLAREEELTEKLEQSKRSLAAAQRRIPKRGAVEMLGKSRCMTELRRQIEKFARADLPVLIVGDTGTGKELVAKAIHEQGALSGAAFVSENCSAIPSELIESELFGHCKGAFTGADDDRVGLFELASGGTLFLDEIGDMPSAMQVKILRALQEGHIRRVGGKATIPVHFRLISATHRNLDDMVKSGEFREDLYYRIGAGIIRVPPLRERGEDCLLIAKHFLGQQNRQYGKKLELSRNSEQALVNYDWPGNVRELEHVIARACILAEGDQLDIALSSSTTASSSEIESPATLNLAEIESRTIKAALRVTGGDKSKAARALGISRTALYAKLKKIAAD